MALAAGAPAGGTENPGRASPAQTPSQPRHWTPTPFQSLSTQAAPFAQPAASSQARFGRPGQKNETPAAPSG